MDMDDAKEAFIIESSELLEEMEYALLNLESAPDDEDLINSIFRSAHTIKGTAGLFGYDDVVSFTHVVETLLDKVRGHQLTINSDVIALLLISQDQISTLVSVAVGELEELDDADKLKIEKLKGSLSELTAVGETRSDEKEVATVDVPTQQQDGETVCDEFWHISVRFSPEVLKNGMDPLSFIRYMAKIGEVVSIAAVDVALPASLDEFDPESCYLGFEISLDANTDKQEIESVFEFVRDDCSLHILPPHAMLAHYAEMIEKLPEENMRLGEILLASGALTEKELNVALGSQGVPQQVAAEKPPMIGDVLVENHDVHRKTVDDAVAKQQKVSGKSNASNRSIRVDAEKLGEQINLVGELVIAGARAQLLAKQQGDEELIESISVMERLVESIRDSALRLRMVQIGDTFKRFQRVVRDVSADIGKNIRLEISGEDTELDKTLVEKIGDPLMHLVRNSMDHGLENEEERIRAGKDKQGVVRLNAYHDSGSIVIEVTDDGRGMSKERILGKAKEKGLLRAGQHLSDSEIYNLIFEPGFSTAEQVTNLSGRGVGMDVVKKNIVALRGSVDIKSSAGEGSSVIIRLPLTLAIIDGFLVEVDDGSYVIPLDMVVECIELTDKHYDELMDQQYINLRGDLLPYVRLRETFSGAPPRDGRENIVVIQYGDIRAGLVVDELMGEFQTVIKPMGKIFERMQGVSGATILGSGEVAVILDVPSLIGEITSSRTRIEDADHAFA